MNGLNVLTGVNVHFGKLIERFGRGDVGEAFSKFIEDDEVLAIFENDVSFPLWEKVDEILQDELRESAELIVSERNLFFNFTIHMISCLFHEAIHEWIDDERSLDEIIISLMKPNIAEKIAVSLCSAYSQILEDEDEIRRICRDIFMESEDSLMDVESIFDGIPGLRGDDAENS